VTLSAALREVGKTAIKVIAATDDVATITTVETCVYAHAQQRCDPGDTENRTWD
jgi:hypothetical protein